jgi:hypothetical protein
MLGRQTTEVIARSRLPAPEGQFERLAQQLGGLFEGGFGRASVFHRLPSVIAAPVEIEPGNADQLYPTLSSGLARLRSTFIGTAAF